MNKSRFVALSQLYVAFPFGLIVFGLVVETAGNEQWLWAIVWSFALVTWAYVVFNGFRNLLTIVKSGTNGIRTPQVNLIISFLFTQGKPLSVRQWVWLDVLVTVMILSGLAVYLGPGM